MKFSVLLLATTVAANGDRAFIDSEKFMTGPEDWFVNGGDKVEREYWANLQNALPDIADQLKAGNSALGNKFVNVTDGLSTAIQKTKAKCDVIKQEKGLERRKRRSPIDERYFKFEEKTLEQLVEDGVWWQFAKYTRNELWACKEYIPIRFEQLIRRIDRLRWWIMRRYCFRIDSSPSFCGYAGKSNKVLLTQKWFTDKYGKLTSKKDLEEEEEE